MQDATQDKKHEASGSKGDTDGKQGISKDKNKGPGSATGSVKAKVKGKPKEQRQSPKNAQGNAEAVETGTPVNHAGHQLAGVPEEPPAAADVASMLGSEVHMCN
jgi:hypothetical protein